MKVTALEEYVQAEAALSSESEDPEPTPEPTPEPLPEPKVRPIDEILKRCTSGGDDISIQKCVLNGAVFPPMPE